MNMTNNTTGPWSPVVLPSGIAAAIVANSAVGTAPSAALTDAGAFGVSRTDVGNRVRQARLHADAMAWSSTAAYGTAAAAANTAARAAKPGVVAGLGTRSRGTPL